MLSEMNTESLRKLREEESRNALTHTPDLFNAILFYLQTHLNISESHSAIPRDSCGSTNCDPARAVETTLSRITILKTEMNKIDMLKLKNGDKDTTNTALYLLSEYRQLIELQKKIDISHYSDDDRKQITPFIETSINCILLEHNKLPIYLSNRLTESFIPYMMPIIIKIFMVLFNSSNSSSTSTGNTSTNTPPVFDIGKLCSLLLSVNTQEPNNTMNMLHKLLPLFMSQTGHDNESVDRFKLVLGGLMGGNSAPVTTNDVVPPIINTTTIETTVIPPSSQLPTQNNTQDSTTTPPTI